MFKKLIVGLLVVASSVCFAGSMGEKTSSYAGFWGGVGGSFTYSTLSGQTYISQVNSAPSSVEYMLSQNNLSHMAPVANLGYYFKVNSDWLIGPKFLYKYIGQEHFDQTWSGSFQDGSYQTASIRTKSIQNFYLLFSGAFEFNQWLLYGGVGPGWANVKVDLNGSVLPASSVVFIPVNMSESKTIIGGAGQVGFEYMLPHRFMVDISYNFMLTQKSAVPVIKFNATGGSYSSFRQSVGVLEQGINITLNKYFDGV